MSNQVKKFRDKILENAELLHYPALELEIVCSPLKKLDNILQIKDALRATNIREGGIGVAAPQIGITKRVFYANINTPDIQLNGVFINPVIEVKGDNVPFNEGCLSMPGYFWTVYRPERVSMEWIDQDSDYQTGEFDGLSARLIQHEMDHLDGKLIIDYLSDDDLEAFHRAWFDEEITGSAIGGPIYVNR